MYNSKEKVARTRDTSNNKSINMNSKRSIKNYIKKKMSTRYQKGVKIVESTNKNFVIKRNIKYGGLPKISQIPSNSVVKFQQPNSSKR